MFIKSRRQSQAHGFEAKHVNGRESNLSQRILMTLSSVKTVLFINWIDDLNYFLENLTFSTTVQLGRK